MLNQSLFPLNSTSFERALESAVKLDCPVPTGDLWNPATCPVALLPWLAWALSVDTWDAAWPEAIQRRVIANSPAVHRAKGTRAAVAAALDGLMVKAGIIEWWQTGGSGVAGTFVVTAFARSRFGNSQPVLTETLIASIRQIVTASAPVSRLYDLQIGIEVALPFAASAARCGQLRLGETPSPRPNTAAAMAMGASAIRSGQLRVMPSPSCPRGAAPSRTDLVVAAARPPALRILDLNLRLVA